MIHQFILAYPRPGMTEPDFQRYWVEVHAVQYAAKIPGIERYLVGTRIALPTDSADPLWCGAAEFWFRSEEDQLASLQSEEFLRGARLDEPNWAAFWRTVVLDTTPHVLLPRPTEAAGDGVKLLVLSKRKEGLPLAEYRSYCLGTHAAKVRELPGLRGYVQGHVRDQSYTVGEALLDCVEELWFDDVQALLAARSAVQQETVDADYELFAEMRYIHRMTVQEHWIIRLPSSA